MKASYNNQLRLNTSVDCEFGNIVLVDKHFNKLPSIENTLNEIYVRVTRVESRWTNAEGSSISTTIIHCACHADCGQLNCVMYYLDVAF